MSIGNVVGATSSVVFTPPDPYTDDSILSSVPNVAATVNPQGRVYGMVHQSGGNGLSGMSMNWAFHSQKLARSADGTLWVASQGLNSVSLYRGPAGGGTGAWTLVETVATGGVVGSANEIIGFLLCNQATNHLHLVHAVGLELRVRTYNPTSGALIDSSAVPTGKYGAGNSPLLDSAAGTQYTAVATGPNGDVLIQWFNTSSGGYSNTNCATRFAVGRWSGYRWKWAAPTDWIPIGGRKNYSMLRITSDGYLEGVCHLNMLYSEWDPINAANAAPSQVYVFPSFFFVRAPLTDLSAITHTELFETAKPAIPLPVGWTFSSAQNPVARHTDWVQDSQGRIYVAYLHNDPNTGLQRPKLWIGRKDGTEIANIEAGGQSFGNARLHMTAAGKLYVVNISAGGAATAVSVMRVTETSTNVFACQSYSTGAAFVPTNAVLTDGSRFMRNIGNTANEFCSGPLHMANDRSGSQPASNFFDAVISVGADYPTTSNSATTNGLRHIQISVAE